MILRRVREAVTGDCLPPTTSGQQIADLLTRVELLAARLTVIQEHSGGREELPDALTGIEGDSSALNALANGLRRLGDRRVLWQAMFDDRDKDISMSEEDYAAKMRSERDVIEQEWAAFAAREDELAAIRSRATEAEDLLGIESPGS